MTAEVERVAWYGKHPAWADYVPESHQPPLAEPFRDWVKTGRDHLARHAPGTGERGECFYVLAPHSDDRLYCGILGPSSDGGKPPRAFPFTVYVPLLRKRFKGLYPLLPAYAVDAWTEMGKAHQKCLAATRAADVEEILAGLAPDVPYPGWGAWRHFSKAMAGIPANDFLETLHSEGKEAAVTLLAVLVESLAPFRDGRLGAPNLAFDLPVSPVLKTAAHQTAFYLTVCGAVLGAAAGEPSCFLYTTEGGRRLGVFLRQPEPADYALVLAGAEDHGRTHRLDAAGLPVSGPLRAATAKAVAGAATLADLLKVRWDRLIKESSS